MKDGKFETLEEIYKSLLEKKKIRYFKFDKETFFHLEDGFIRDQDGSKFTPNFENLEYWSLYQEPGKPKEKRLYAYKMENGSMINFSVKYCPGEPIYFGDQFRYFYAPEYDIIYSEEK